MKNSYKEGDRVEILGKSYGVSLNYRYNNGKVWKRGDIGIIDQVNARTYRLEGSPGTFVHEDLRLLRKFRKGDEVVVVGKSAGQSLEQCQNRTNPAQRYKIGQIIKIDYISYSEYTHYVSNNDYFLEKDLMSIEEYKKYKEKSMKYKVLKNLIVKPLHEQGNGSTYSSDNNNFITTMIKDFGYRYYDIINMDKDFFAYVEKHSCFIKWLLRNKFIEEIKVFKPFDLTFHIESEDQLLILYHRLGYCPLHKKDYTVEAYKSNTTIPVKDDYFKALYANQRLFDVVYDKVKEMINK